MRRSLKAIYASAVSGGFVVLMGGDLSAVPIEQTQDLYVHTVTGTAATGAFLKGGKNFDGGEANALLQWNIGAFPSPLGKAVGTMKRISGDGSFSVHQMLTSWTEGTAFGTTLPVAGVDYVREPIAAFGFNETKSSDQFDGTRMFRYFQDNPSSNKGLIVVPRGRFNNTGYSGTFDNEVLLASRERVPGSIDTDDQSVDATAGTVGHINGVLKPLEDTAIQQNSPTSSFYGDFSSVSIYDAANSKHMPLFKFGFGELMFDGVDRSGGGYSFSQADLELHTSTGGPSSTFTVHRMLTNWDEATATWNQFGASGPQSGVHYDASSLGTYSLGGANGSVTIGLAALASSWLANPSSNFGIILVPTTTGTMNDNLGLFSSERVPGTLDSDDPRLIVQLVPEPSMIGIVPLAAGILMRRRQTR